MLFDKGLCEVAPSELSSGWKGLVKRSESGCTEGRLFLWEQLGTDVGV